MASRSVPSASSPSTGTVCSCCSNPAYAVVETFEPHTGFHSSLALCCDHMAFLEVCRTNAIKDCPEAEDAVLEDNYENACTWCGTTRNTRPTFMRQVANVAKWPVSIHGAEVWLLPGQRWFGDFVCPVHMPCWLVMISSMASISSTHPARESQASSNAGLDNK